MSPVLTIIRTKTARFAGLVSVITLLTVVGPASVKLLAQQLGTFAPGVEREIWQQLLPTWSSQGSVALQWLFGVAVDNSTGDVFVADQFHNSLIKFTNAGVPTYFTPPSADPSTRGTGGAEVLFQPEGVAIDAARKLVVGDSFNYRLAVLSSDGTLAFEVPFPGANPTGVAVSPGAIVTDHDPGNPGNLQRVVVTDKYSCYVYIYDADFNLVRRIGTGNATNADGDFSSPSAAAIDGAGHIYITDYDYSRVEIFDKNGVYLGKFGTPPASGDLPPDALQGPYGIMVDHRGRVIVSDTENQRLTAWSVNYSTSPPAATYLFFLNAAGDLNGHPTGVAEDLSTDPIGRIVVADTTNDRLQRFQVPDLAVVQVATTPITTTGTFGVVVPVGKAAGVVRVIPVVTSTNAFPLLPVVIPQPPASSSLPTPVINPGEIATYSFSYTPTGVPVSFSIVATGNDGHTVSNTVGVSAAVPCANCSSSVQFYTAPVTVPPVAAVPAANGWYGRTLVARITATSAVGVGKIVYMFTSGPELGAQPGLHAYSSGGASTSSVDVPLTQDGRSVLAFWTVNSKGEEETPHQQITTPLDLTPPNLQFHFESAAPLPNAAGWWRTTPVLVPFAYSDNVAGVVLGNGSATSPISFTAQGANQSRSVTVVDGVGHSVTALSSNGVYNGQPVNIDTTAPVLIPPANVTLKLSSPSGAQLAAGQFQATASDALSGVKSINNPTAGPSGQFFPLGVTAWSFFATDVADNVSATQTRTITVTETGNTAPVCTAAVASPSILWPPNHRLVPVSILGVTDAEHDAITMKILSIFQDEPTNGGGDGNTSIDGVGVGTSQASVRAERSGGDEGNGRVYYITYSATDPGGASCTGTVTVSVPHDMAHPAVGDGATYDSTVAGPAVDDDEHHDCGDGKDHNKDTGKDKNEHDKKFHAKAGKGDDGDKKGDDRDKKN